MKKFGDLKIKIPTQIDGKTAGSMHQLVGVPFFGLIFVYLGFKFLNYEKLFLGFDRGFV